MVCILLQQTIAGRPCMSRWHGHKYLNLTDPTWSESLIWIAKLDSFFGEAIATSASHWSLILQMPRVSRKFCKNVFFCTSTGIRVDGTDYGRPVRKSPSLHGRQSTPTPTLPQLPKFSDFFDSCLHWVSVVRGRRYRNKSDIIIKSNLQV